MVDGEEMVGVGGDVAVQLLARDGNAHRRALLDKADRRLDGEERVARALHLVRPTLVARVLQRQRRPRRLQYDVGDVHRDSQGRTSVYGGWKRMPPVGSIVNLKSPFGLSAISVYGRSGVR